VSEFAGRKSRGLRLVIQISVTGRLSAPQQKM